MVLLGGIQDRNATSGLKCRAVRAHGSVYSMKFFNEAKLLLQGKESK